MSFKKIQIDDAGTGDLLGGAFIGFFVKETNQYIFKEISLSYFQQNNFNIKFIEDLVAELIEKSLKELDFNPDCDRIEICTGNVFKKAIEMMKNNKYHFVCTKIENPLQNLVEQTYLDYLKSIGFNKEISLIAGRDRYFQLFNWVVEDFPNREKFVKTGFPSWNLKWREIAKNKYLRIKRKSKYI